MTALRDPLLSCAHLADAADSPFSAASATPLGTPLAIARSEDRIAIAELYAKHAKPIHRFLCDLLGDAALAADATQETFVRAFRRIDTLRDGSRVAPWLFGVARNVSFELRKARCRSQRVFTTDGDAGDAASTRCSPEAELLGREAAQIVSVALATLSEDRRAVLLLRLDHGLAYDEIAELMGWSLAKVKVEIHRAREVLRATLVKYQEGGAR